MTLDSSELFRKGRLVRNIQLEACIALFRVALRESSTISIVKVHSEANLSVRRSIIDSTVCVMLMLANMSVMGLYGRDPGVVPAHRVTGLVAGAVSPSLDSVEAAVAEPLARAVGEATRALRWV